MINMMSPKTVVKLLSYWPPYLMAGVKIDYVQDDFKKIVKNETTFLEYKLCWIPFWGKPVFYDGSILYVYVA